MKLKKLLLTFVLALFIIPCLVMFAGCTINNEENLTGSWKFSKIIYQEDGIEKELEIGEIFAEFELTENFYVLDLSADGTWVLTSNISDIDITGIWVRTSTGVTLTATEEPEPIECTISEGHLMFSSPDGTISFVLVKE